MLKKIIIVILVISLVYINAGLVPKERTSANEKCGGGCVTSTQCAAWAGNTDCR
ncbi:unnamed protein product, partial [Rotaria sp. Silwood1]